MRKTLGVIGATAIASIGVLAFSGTSFAETTTTHYPASDWRIVYTNYTNAEQKAKTSTITSADTVELVGKGVEVTDQTKHYGVSLETHNLDLAGSSVTVHYELKGDASFAAGAVRLFVYDKTNADTMKDAPAKFAAADAKSGTLAIELPFSGKIGTVGLVYDSSNSKAAGSVVFSNLTVDNTKVLFQRPVTTPPTTKPAEPKKCEAYLYTGTKQNLCDRFANVTGKLKCEDVGYRVTLVNKDNDPWGLDLNGRGVKGVGCEAYPLKPKATPSPSHSKTSPPVTGGNNNGSGGLPVTGSKTGTIAAIGGIAIVIGAIAAVAARRRKAEFRA